MKEDDVSTTKPSGPESTTTGTGTPNAKGSTQGSARSVVQIIAAASAIEGGGFEVYRPFPGSAADWFDPFLLLDEMAPHTKHPARRSGLPPILTAASRP